MRWLLILALLTATAQAQEAYWLHPAPGWEQGQQRSLDWMKVQIVKRENGGPGLPTILASIWQQTDFGGYELPLREALRDPRPIVKV